MSNEFFVWCDYVKGDVVPGVYLHKKKFELVIVKNRFPEQFFLVPYKINRRPKREALEYIGEYDEAQASS